MPDARVARPRIRDARKGGRLGNFPTTTATGDDDEERQSYDEAPVIVGQRGVVSIYPISTPNPRFGNCEGKETLLLKLGEGKEAVSEDKQFGGTVPCENIDDFDTQVMDFDDETQPVDLGDEAQIWDLAGETQIMDYDFIEHMDTQLLDVSDNETEGKGDGEGAERTQLLHDTDELPDRCADQETLNVGDRAHRCYEDDGEAKRESPPTNYTSQSSGSSRRGFTAIRTASLRAGGLAARRMASISADNGSCSTQVSSGSMKLHSLNDYDGILNVVTVDIEHDAEKDNHKGLINENKSKVVRSMARKLFVEEDVAEEGSHDSFSSGRTDLHQLPACDNELAGLSYVDSQEPGELSQVKALEFIDQLLKRNILELDEERTHESSAGVIAHPCAIAKGPQSLVQQVNHRRSIAGASVFNWDDTHEDEGGGEFFTKKKEELFGTSSGSQQCCTRPRSSRQPRGSQSAGKFRNEKEQQSMHDKIMSFVHSDSKLVKSRKICQLEEINRKMKVDNYADYQLGLDSCNRELLAVAPNAELMDNLNVGIDTQMAAEAMEALSTGSALVTNDGSVADHDLEDGRERCKKEATKKGLLKRSSARKRPCLSKSDIGTRSKLRKPSTMKHVEESKYSVALRTRSQYAVEEFNNDVLKPKGNSRRLNMKNICAENEKESSSIISVRIGGKKRVCVLEQELNKSGSLPVERRSLRGKISSTPVARKTRQQISLNNLNDAGDASGVSRGQRDFLDMVPAGKVKRKRSTRSDVASENLNAREEALNLNSVADSIKVDGSNRSGKDVQHTSNQVNGSAKRKSLLLASVGPPLVLQSIARRTRSKSTASRAEVPQEGEGLHFREMLPIEDPCQLSSEKQKACSSPAKVSVSHLAIEESPEVVQKSSSPANITPVNLKTPRSAVSPICVGDEYPSPSCKKNLSLKNEFHRLTSSESKYCSPLKDLRQRRVISSIRVLFSQHLDEDIIRQQKKILSRLGVPVVSSILDATHFVADVFVRTRNMLEAIANGKPVVTHLWLESCGQASCFIDEKNYILRDAKKERELGFSMPISLARASHHPLLVGRSVLITPHIKPSKEIVSSLVKAVRGQAIERLCRSMSSNDRLPDDVLVLSCEEDFEVCPPLLEKGIAVYSSELLLNGIITQQLEYERYRIFVDHVKKHAQPYG